MGSSRIISVPAHSVNVGNLIYNKYERTLSEVKEKKEVYKTKISKKVLDIEEEVRKREYEEYVEDECKEGFSYYATKAINLIKQIAVGDPRERVMYEIESHNKMGNDIYGRFVKIYYTNDNFNIVRWNDNVQIKQDIDDIPIV